MTTPNTNPVVLDSSGRAGSIFLPNLKYKVVLAPANDTDPRASPIWTIDPVYTSGVSTVAQVQAVNGNPNGQLAGMDGSATDACKHGMGFYKRHSLYLHDYGNVINCGLDGD